MIVTGLSGAGKSLALSRLEDNGYYCVDNLPSAMLKDFVDQCRHAGIARAAVSVDGRERAYGLGAEVLENIRALGVRTSILFLDCGDEELSRRFTETRRRHPFFHDGDVRLGIAEERALLLPLREAADIVVDTTALAPNGLFSRLDDALSLSPIDQMRVIITSFGFKRGIPQDAELLFDMRFLPNPFYMPKLRSLSGLDAPIGAFLRQSPETGLFLEQTEALLRTVLPGFCTQGRKRVMIAFGCTGGRHRSVFAAEQMAVRLQEYHVIRRHRDLQLEEAAIEERFSPR